MGEKKKKSIFFPNPKQIGKEPLNEGLARSEINKPIKFWQYGLEDKKNVDVVYIYLQYMRKSYNS